MDIAIKIITATLIMGTSLTYATIGEIFTEKSGILNLGMEGIMLTGALSAFATVYYTGSLLLGVIVAAIAGALLATIHAFLSIAMRANQIVSGLAITMFGCGLANFLGFILGPPPSNNLVGLNLPVAFHNIEIPFLSKIPVLGGFFNVSVLTYALYVIIPLAWFIMYKTKYGQELRAVGENPRTAASMGISVSKTRYLYTIIGGAMAGIGGACISLYHTPSWNKGMTGGKGWIVIALVIFSGWNPARAVIGILVFSGIIQLQFSIQAMSGGGFLLSVLKGIPSQFYGMAPYLITFLTLTVMTIISQAKHKPFASPSALGTSFSIEEK